MAEPNPPPPRPQEPTREPPDRKGEKPYIPRSLRETGGTDAQKAGDQEQRVSIGNAGKRENP
jgi:hypothetical protein